MDDAEKLFEKAKKYEFTQTPEGNEINGPWIVRIVREPFFLGPLGQQNSD